MEGGSSSVLSKLWNGLAKNHINILLLTIPTLVATGYVVWTYHCKRRAVEISIATAAIPVGPVVKSDELNEESNEEQPLGPNIPLSNTDCNRMSSKPFPSPTDSGYQEPSSPDKSKDSDTNYSVVLTPPTSCSLGGTQSAIDTTIIRGGRARTTIQLPIDIIGRFIGRSGKNIKSLMAESGAQIHVQQKNLSKDATIVPCILQGTQTQISKAIDAISLRHPEVTLPSPQMYVPPLSIFSSSSNGATSWEYTLKLSHSPVAVFLCIVTYIEKLNRIWVVPYSSTQLLEELHQSMAASYKAEDTMDNNGDENMMNKFCAVRVNEIYWLRGKVVGKSAENEEGHYEVRLMDYGSSVIVPLCSLKPLRKEHTQVPIQSFPFLLANVQPINSDSEDSMLVLQALVEGAVLEAHPTDRISAEDQTQYLELYTQSPHGTNGQTFINRELVNQGFAVWREVPIPDSPSSVSSSPPLSPVTYSTSNTIQPNDNENTITTSTRPSSTSIVNAISTGLMVSSGGLEEQLTSSSTTSIPVTLSDLLSGKPHPANDVFNEGFPRLPSPTIDPIKALFGEHILSSQS